MEFLSSDLANPCGCSTELVGSLWTVLAHTRSPVSLSLTFWRCHGTFQSCLYSFYFTGWPLSHKLPPVGWITSSNLHIFSLPLPCSAFKASRANARTYFFQPDSSEEMTKWVCVWVSCVRWIPNPYLKLSPLLIDFLYPLPSNVAVCTQSCISCSPQSRGHPLTIHPPLLCCRWMQVLTEATQSSGGSTSSLTDPPASIGKYWVYSYYS